MRRNQILLLFLLSILFGLAAVFFAKQWMDKQMTPQQQVEVVEREPVVVAAIEILVGSVIEPQHLTTKLLEKSWRDASQFSDPKQVIGQIVASSIYPGEIIYQQRLTAAGEGSALAALIPEKMRAITIRVNDVIGVAGFLLPGNRVDVLNTVSYSKGSATTSTVLKDIKVLAVDQTARSTENKPIIVRAVTLEVTPEQAEKLLSAQSKGEIQLTLRNPHEPEEKVAAVSPRYVAPSVTIIKGTESSKVQVKE
ncbi:MAG: Flp pilus assembly protein CpaB [Vibrio sp.]